MLQPERGRADVLFPRIRLRPELQRMLCKSPDGEVRGHCSIHGCGLLFQPNVLQLGYVGASSVLQQCVTELLPHGQHLFCSKNAAMIN
jgi:hypothetical protein